LKYALGNSNKESKVCFRKSSWGWILKGDEMKAVMISYNQSITEEVEEILQSLDIRGFTRWLNVQGQGTQKGDPRLGTHVWPSLNSVILTIVEDDKVELILNKVSNVNKEAEEEGIRAFVWNIERNV
jgi:nitrogen regulatory protein PII